MELRHFRYFVVAAEEENFNRAAERLHIAQSALSRQIKDLETELGVQLFDRHHQRVYLSEIGRIYLAEVRRILDEVDQVNKRTQGLARGEFGLLRISLHNAAVRYASISRILHTFRISRPNIELALSQMHSPDQLGAVRERLIDAGFVLTIRDETDRELDHIQLATDEFVLAMPHNHPLASRKSLRLADLDGEPFLWLQRSSNPPVYDRLMNACLSGGLSPRIVQHVVSQEVIPHLAAIGMGVGFVLSYARQRGTKVVFRKVIDLNLPLQLDLVWRRDNASAALRQFVDIVAKSKEHKVRKLA